MHSPTEAALRPPTHLAHIEAWANMPITADTEAREQLYTDPSQLHPNKLDPLRIVYTTALRRVAEYRLEHTDHSAPWDAQTPGTRTVKSEIRSLFMTHDPNLCTPAVNELKRAIGSLSTMSSTADRTHDFKPSSERPPADQLPAHAIPTSSVDKVVTMSYGSPYTAATYWSEGPLERVNLPGPGRPETIIPWTFVHYLEAKHGRQPYIGPIDYKRLPDGPEDADPDKIAYARELQKKIVPVHKLVNIPDIGAALPNRLPVAQPHHISRQLLRKLMGGGYAFIDSYCQEHSIPLRHMERAEGAGFGRGNYMTLEDAAEIWEAYRKIPQAEPSDVPIAQILKSTGSGKKLLASVLSDEEKQKMLYDKRALRPRGRVLKHTSPAFAKEVRERIQRPPLPVDKIPAGLLERRFDISYSGIMKRLDRLEERGLTSLDTRLHLKVAGFGKDKPVRCVSWQDVRELDRTGNVLPDSPEINYNYLPEGPNDDTKAYELQARYAKAIQAGVFGADALTIGISQEAATILEEMTSPANAADLIEWLQTPEAARLLPVSTLTSSHESNQNVRQTPRKLRATDLTSAQSKHSVPSPAASHSSDSSPPRILPDHSPAVSDENSPPHTLSASEPNTPPVPNHGPNQDTTRPNQHHPQDLADLQASAKSAYEAGHLSRQQVTILDLSINGHTLTEIGTAIGVTGEGVRRELQKTVHKLQTHVSSYVPASVLNMANLEQPKAATAEQPPPAKPPAHTPQPDHTAQEHIGAEEEHTLNKAFAEAHNLGLITGSQVELLRLWTAEPDYDQVARNFSGPMNARGAKAAIRAAMQQLEVHVARTAARGQPVDDILVRYVWPEPVHNAERRHRTE